MRLFVNVSFVGGALLATVGHHHFNASSARFSRRTFTHGSPNTSSARPVVLSATR